MKAEDYYGKEKIVGNFLDHMLMKIDEQIKKWWKSLIISLTKKSAEEVSNLLVSKWYKAYYLHSEIDTLQRYEIIKHLRTGKIDILVWVNLLREGIDLPEVTFIWILDADSEGFLRSEVSLIQLIGRAARNPEAQVALYADRFTKSMIKALNVTYHRRKVQDTYNKKNGIVPTIAYSNIKNLEAAKSDDAELIYQDKSKKKRIKRMTKKEKEMILAQLDEQLKTAIKNWEFETAAQLRDQIKEISA